MERLYVKNKRKKFLWHIVGGLALGVIVPSSASDGTAAAGRGSSEPSYNYLFAKIKTGKFPKSTAEQRAMMFQCERIEAIAADSAKIRDFASAKKAIEQTSKKCPILTRRNPEHSIVMACFENAHIALYEHLLVGLEAYLSEIKSAEDVIAQLRSDLALLLLYSYVRLYTPHYSLSSPAFDRVLGEIQSVIEKEIVDEKKGDFGDPLLRALRQFTIWGTSVCFAAEGVFNDLQPLQLSHEASSQNLIELGKLGNIALGEERDLTEQSKHFICSLYAMGLGSAGAHMNKLCKAFPICDDDAPTDSSEAESVSDSETAIDSDTKNAHE